MGQAVEIQIEDNGLGIAPDLVPLIFDRFFTTRADVGAGLGLYFAKVLLARFDGTIRVLRTAPSAGTTIAITLPVSGRVIEDDT